MGIWDRLTGPFRARNEIRRDDPIRLFQWVSTDQPSGIVVTPETALQISVVWACVMAITTAISSCRWNVTLFDGANREILPDDPLDYLLNVRPNPEMTAVAFRESLMMNATTWGNGYAEIVKNARGQPSALWPLLPDRTLPRRDKQTGVLYYEHRQMDGGMMRLEAEQVFHLHGPGITGLMGDNFVARAAKAMSLAAAQERFASTYFGNNTNMGGILKYPKKLSTDAHKKLKDDWEDKFKGPFKANRPAILEDGMEWLPSNVEADKAQLTNSRTFQIEEICRFYGVPPHKVQHLARATFSNIEHLGIEFVRDSLTPWAKRVEQEGDYKLIPARGPRKMTQIDMGWLTHGDAKSRFEAYSIGRNIGVYSANDILAMEGKNRLPGRFGDVRIIPMNMTTYDNLIVPKTSAPGTGSDGGGAASPPNEAAQPDDGSGTPGFGDRATLVKDSMEMVFGSALERYAKRLTARAADLERHNLSAAKVAVNLAEERQRLRPWLLEECHAAIELSIRALPGTDAAARDVGLLAAADSIDNGTDPHEAAERLVATFTVTQGAA